MFIVGALCLPLTYHANRYGEWVISSLVIATIAGIGDVLATRLGPLHLLKSIGSFAAGALMAEIVMFLYYYLSYGHSDPSLTVGQAVALVEFLFIAGVGAVAIFLVGIAVRRITMRSSRP